MKKVLILVVAIAILLPGAASAKEPSLFSIYLKDRTPENFLKAFEHYESLRADTVNYSAASVLAYLSLIELEKNLEILEENKAELKNKTMFSYGNILLELGRYDESIAIYDMLNEKSPKWSCPWRHKGEAYWKHGELASAVMALKKAIETRETHYDAYVMLADVYRDLEEYETALETLEKGLTYYGKDIEDPEEEVANIDVAFLHLDLLKKCGKKAEYDEMFEKLTKIYPDDERLK
ncbi:MAG: tetratricopeptide repeat protein [Candidatus Krumholzibacteria bacterium]|nr:tetratricopeptide repeat protein [Candidatus Krumholzibacteria bacterium]